MAPSGAVFICGKGGFGESPLVRQANAKRWRRTSPRSGDGPEGVRAGSPNNPSLSAVQSRLCPASLQDSGNDTRIQLLTSNKGVVSSPLSALLQTKFPRNPDLSQTPICLVHFADLTSQISFFASIHGSQCQAILWLKEPESGDLMYFSTDK